MRNADPANIAFETRACQMTASESGETGSPELRHAPAHALNSTIGRMLMSNDQQLAIPQLPDPAPLPRDATQKLSGLEQVRGMRDGIFGIAPMQALMNMRLIEVKEGFVVFTAVPEEKHYNPQGTVHGAFATAILDSAMGLAVVTKLPPGISRKLVYFP